MEERPLFRMDATPCEDQPGFVYNKRFKVLKGQKYFVDGEQKFPSMFQYVTGHDESPCRESGLKKDGHYSTKFGPCISHNGKIYCDCNPCQKLAFRRMSAMSFPEILGEYELLRANQKKFFKNNREFFVKTSTSYEDEFIGYTDAESLAEEYHDLPHAKRLLRIQAWEELTRGDRATRHERMWLKKVLYKMKKAEIAKPGKVPRMIGDLGVAASLQGFMITKLLKNAMARKDILVGGGRLHFCSKPQPSEMIQVFKNLISPPERFYFVYFSDDSCMSVRDDDGEVHIFNVDIRKCDASHTSGVFQGLLDSTPGIAKEDMQVLIDQCKMPIELRDKLDRRRKIKLMDVDGDPKLYSGSTITTILNNTANIAGALAFSAMKYTGPETIHAAFRQAGYTVTLDKCEIEGDIQFLKHSPVRDTGGNLRSLLNVGVLLRLSGTCKGDLPGRGPFGPRADSFQKSLLSGVYSNCSFPLIHAMRRKVSGATLSDQGELRVSEMLKYKVIQEDGEEKWEATAEEVYKRYRLGGEQITDLDHNFGNAGYTNHYNCEAATLILAKDYQLACQKRPFNTAT